MSFMSRRLVLLISIRKVIINHRACDVSVALVEDILRPFGSTFVHMTYEEHDEVTANTQAVTHAAFLRYVP